MLLTQTYIYIYIYICIYIYIYINSTSCKILTSKRVCFREASINSSCIFITCHLTSWNTFQFLGSIFIPPFVLSIQGMPNWPIFNEHSVNDGTRFYLNIATRETVHNLFVQMSRKLARNDRCDGFHKLNSYHSNLRKLLLVHLYSRFHFFEI